MFLSTARWREISPTRAVGSVLRRTLDFRGRSGRAEFWWWQAAVMVAAPQLFWWVYSSSALVTDAVYDWLFIGFELAVLLPSMAVGVRRLHDIGLPGWPALLLEPILRVPDSVSEFGAARLAEPFGYGFDGYVPGNGASMFGVAVPPSVAVALTIAQISLMVFIPLAALLPSRKQANRWGPPPGVVRQAEVFS